MLLNHKLPTNKIFVIGFHRTGTRAIASCLNECGLRVIHYPDPLCSNIVEDLRNPNQPWSTVNQNDGLADIITVPYFKELDVLYPNSKFILTVRNKLEWQTAVVHHLDRVAKNAFDHPPIRQEYDEKLHEILYGKDRSIDNLWSRHLAHLQNVHDYFNGTAKLLVLNIFIDSSSERLEAFLGINCRSHFKMVTDRPELPKT